jgi:hypothetical protein
MVMVLEMSGVEKMWELISLVQVSRFEKPLQSVAPRNDFHHFLKFMAARNLNFPPKKMFDISRMTIAKNCKNSHHQNMHLRKSLK